MFDNLGVLREEPMMLLRQELREPASYYSILQSIAGGNSSPSLSLNMRVSDLIRLEHI